MRFAQLADLPRIWELLNGLATYERWSEYVTGTPERLGELLFGERPAAEVLLVERSGRVVGYALFYPTLSSFRTRTMLWLEDLFVEEGERGMGTGRTLLAALARLAVRRGHARIDWHVLDWNLPSIGFYERIGARRSATDVHTYSLGAAEPAGHGWRRRLSAPRVSPDGAQAAASAWLSGWRSTRCLAWKARRSVSGTGAFPHCLPRASSPAWS